MGLALYMVNLRNNSAPAFMQFTGWWVDKPRKIIRTISRLPQDRGEGISKTCGSGRLPRGGDIPGKGA